MTGDPRPESAAGRVARFSRLMWLVAGAGVLVLALAAAPAIWVDPATDEIIVQQPEWSADLDVALPDGMPWEGAGAPDAVLEAGVWHASGAARIRLDGLTPGEPLRIASPNELLRPTRAWVFTGTETPGEPGDDPVNLRLFRDENYLIPAAATAELWVAPSTTRRWELEIAEARLPERSGDIQGSGPSAFRYRGDATVARATLAPGEGNEIRVFGAGAETVVEFPEGRGERTVSWPDPGPGGAVVVIATARPDDAWSLWLQDEEHRNRYGGTGTDDRNEGGA
ncbi:hypothetical protein NHL51_11705 [Leucobacter sp. gxy201]|uniref:hypothetical protein n=1 Tax=Leucobacter sp. gxy201 TaxID=2957200 RepID=UPI003DA1C227